MNLIGLGSCGDGIRCCHGNAVKMLVQMRKQAKYRITWAVVICHLPLQIYVSNKTNRSTCQETKILLIQEQLRHVISVLFPVWCQKTWRHEADPLSGAVTVLPHTGTYPLLWGIEARSSFSAERLPDQRISIVLSQKPASCRRTAWGPLAGPAEPEPR